MLLLPGLLLLLSLFKSNNSPHCLSPYGRADYTAPDLVVWLYLRNRVVPQTRIELVRIAPQDFKSWVSANSTIEARWLFYTSSWSTAGGLRTVSQIPYLYTALKALPSVNYSGCGIYTHASYHAGTGKCNRTDAVS